MSKFMVFYTDGSYSSKANKAGVGVIGYSYEEASRPNGVNVPMNDKYFFGKESILKSEKGVEKDNIKIIDFYESVSAIFGERISNANGEVAGLRDALKLILSDNEVTQAYIHIDSEYVVKGYNSYLDNWKTRDWCTTSGKPIACMSLWREIDRLKEELICKGVSIDVRWVKGHGDSYGNNLADRYATMGTNYGKFYMDRVDYGEEELLNKVTKISDLRKELEEPNFARYHRYMMFGNESSEYHCLTNHTVPKDRVDILGYRYNKTTYSITNTRMPEYIDKIISLYREIEHMTSYHVLNLPVISNKDDMRLLEIVDPRCLLTWGHKKGRYSLCKYDTGEVVASQTDNLILHPFVMSAVNTFDRLSNFEKERKLDLVDAVIDVTDRFIDGGKLIIGSADKLIPLEVKGYQSVSISVGEDTPPYLFLNKYASEINKIEILIDSTSNPNYHTIAFRLGFDNGIHISTRTMDRFITARR